MFIQYSSLCIKVCFVAAGRCDWVLFNFPPPFLWTFSSSYVSKYCQPAAIVVSLIWFLLGYLVNMMDENGGCVCSDR